jgi:tRNA-splicing ligase RtcB
MSRKAANERFNWKDVNRFLRERGVTLISAGLDEVPMAYKNIREVMAAQKDLVTTLGQFDPKLVKMAPSGASGRLIRSEIIKRGQIHV